MLINVMTGFCGGGDDYEESLFRMLLDFGIEASKSKASGKPMFSREVLCTFVDA